MKYVRSCSITMLLGSICSSALSARKVLYLLLMLVSPLTVAEMYRCLESSGQVNFTDIPCAPGSGEKVDQSALPVLNSASGLKLKPLIRNSPGFVYQLREPDGTVRTVGKDEYETQMEKNRENDKQILAANDLEVLRLEKSRQCFNHRKSLKRLERIRYEPGIGKRRESEQRKSDLQQKLILHCGGL